MWRACLLLLALVAGSRQLSITEFVVPKTVEAGENATLQCQYNLTEGESENALFVKWWWTPMNGSSDQRILLYQRITGQEAKAIRHNIEVDEDDSIILLNATPSDSGIYECEVSEIDEVRRHQELVVFTKGSGPEVNATVDEDDEDVVLITCNATDVAPYPHLQITVKGELVDASELVIGPSDGLYSIYQNANVSKEQANEGEIRCDLFFENPNITAEPYTNIEWFFDPKAPAASAPPEDAAPTAEPGASPAGSGCEKFGASWMLLITISYMYFI